MAEVKELAAKARELQKKGLKPFEIGDELHLGVDTVTYLLEEGAEGTLPPSDVKIGWRSLGVSAHRMWLTGEILADMAREELDRQGVKADSVAGIALNGVSFAGTIAQIIEAEVIVYRPPSERANSGGAFSSNYASPKGKKVVVVDDVLSTGHAMESAVNDIRESGGEPVVCLVMVNKSSLDDIGGVRLRGMIRARSIGGTILGGGPLRSFAYK